VVHELRIALEEATCHEKSQQERRALLEEKLRKQAQQVEAYEARARKLPAELVRIRKLLHQSSLRKQQRSFDPGHAPFRPQLGCNGAVADADAA